VPLSALSSSATLFLYAAGFSTDEKATFSGPTLVGKVNPARAPADAPDLQGYFFAKEVCRPMRRARQPHNGVYSRELSLTWCFSLSLLSRTLSNSLHRSTILNCCDVSRFVLSLCLLFRSFHAHLCLCVLISLSVCTPHCRLVKNVIFSHCRILSKRYGVVRVCPFGLVD
jgi:hypothetical protein